MKKFLCLCFIFLISSFKAFASDIKFVQIDSLKYSPNSQDSVDNFRKTINEINKLKDINFVIFTGNNITRSDEDYLKSFLRMAKKLNTPFYVALGHKDLNKKKGLSKNAYTKIVQHYTFRKTTPNYAFSRKGILFIVADGAKEFIATPFGYYRENTIDFIDKTLTKNSKKNAVILQHFPIYPPKQDEAYRTYKAEEYFAMLKKHNNVKAIISGFGVNSENDFGGIKHITTADFPHYRIIEIIDGTSSDPTIWSTLK